MSAPSRFTVPSRADAVAHAGTEVIGGPTGRHVRRSTGWRPAAAILSALSGVMVALGLVQKGHCVQNGWGSPGALWRACYSDLPTAVGNHAEQPWSAGGPGEQQPILTATLSWLVRQVVPDGTGRDEQRLYFLISAVLIALGVAAGVVLLARTMPDTPWLAAHLALSPVLVTTALISFDVLGVVLATAGICAWLRSRPAWAGVLLGAAALSTTYPLILAAAVVLVALRDRAREALTSFVAGLLGAIAVVLAAATVLGDTLAPYRQWWDAPVGYGSPWRVLQISHVAMSAHTASWLAIIGWAVALATGAFLVSRPAHLTPLAPLALTMLAIVMATGKTFTPQEGLWVLPLLALCGLEWREHLVWAGVEVLYFVTLWPYVAHDSNPAKALAGAGHAVFTIVRLAAYAGLAWVAWLSADELQDDRTGVLSQEPDRTDVVPAPAG